MGISNKYRIITLIAVVFLFGFSFLPYAKAQEWALTGNVINGATCKAVVGAKVSSLYNDNASNLTDSVGNYTLLLGQGSWNVTVNAVGFVPITFNTPYETVGSYKFDTYLLAPGAVKVNCTKGFVAANSTVPTTVTISTVPPSTAATTIIQTSQSSPSSSKGLLEVGAGVIVLIIIIVVAFFAMSGKKAKKEEPKANEAEEKKA